MTKQANVDLDLFIKKELLGPKKPGRLYRQWERDYDFMERMNPRTKNIAQAFPNSLKITQKDIDRIKRLKKHTRLPDRYVNYNSPAARKSYKKSVELANSLKVRYGVNATPVNPKDRAKENIEAYQSGLGIIKPVYSKGTYGIDTPGDWDPYGKDWIPGTPRSVKEEVAELERKNRKQ